MKTSPFPATHLPGQGFSCSSVTAVLESAAELLQEPGGRRLITRPADLRLRVAHRALLRERAAARASVAADDVYPMVNGGAGLVRTDPDEVDKAGKVSPGFIHVTPLEVDRRWIRDHLVVAVRPDGIRHEVPSLFTNLFRNPQLARECVAVFSEFARLAGRALAECDVRGLAGAINSYRAVFDAWLGIALGTPHPFTRYAQPMAASLPPGALGWKPPGAGSCESLIVVAADRAANQRIVAHLRKHGWLATPACLTGGLRVSAAPDGWQVSAGHRIDLIGAADLGMDPRVALPGTCCSLAIAPRVHRLVATDRSPRHIAEALCA